ncbi:MAG: hypothetical protein QXK96_01875, partial [Candidatus Bathyarchaeia archaeon]
EVEPDQLYPKKPLYVKYKGTSYYVGDIMPEGPNVFPSEEQMDEQLDTVLTFRRQAPFRA